MIFFTSDTHFGHANVIQRSNRPFADINEHDNKLILNWNSVVSRKDTVYHCGDFCWDKKRLASIADSLNGSIHLILGNHDWNMLSALKKARFAGVHDTLYVRYNSDRFWLSHYAHLTWPNSHRGTYHVFGHSHGMRTGVGRSCDVGVDCWSYTPVSIDTIIATLKDKPFNNHHEEDQ